MHSLAPVLGCSYYAYRRLLRSTHSVRILLLDCNSGNYLDVKFDSYARMPGAFPSYKQYTLLLTPSSSSYFGNIPTLAVENLLLRPLHVRNILAHLPSRYTLFIHLVHLGSISLGWLRNKEPYDDAS